MPPVEDRLAWAVPAEPAEVEDCAAFLVTAIEPALANNPNRLRALVAVVAMQGYSRAELLLAMKRLPVTNAYGMGFRPDVLDEIVQKSRAVRRIAADPADGKPRLLTEWQMRKACDDHPEHFRSEDFGIATYDPDDRPLYRYARKSGPHAHAPRPQLDEAPAVHRVGAGTAATLGDALDSTLDDAGNAGGNVRRAA